jgi:hypothetical protein
VQKETLNDGAYHLTPNKLERILHFKSILFVFIIDVVKVMGMRIVWFTMSRIFQTLLLLFMCPTMVSKTADKADMDLLWFHLERAEVTN